VRRIALAVLLLAAGGLVLFAWPHLPRGAPSPGEPPESSPRPSAGNVWYGPPNSIAVLPFHAAADDRSAALAYAFAADLLSRLAELPELRVTARESAFFFRDPGIAPRVVSERLQARFLVTGEWAADDSRVVLHLDLHDTLAGRSAWSRDYDAPVDDLPAVLENIVAELQEPLPVPDFTPLPPAPRVAFDAWSAYAQGLYRADPLGDRDPPAAAADFQRALESDPAFDAARLALAVVWLRPGWPESDSAANRERARDAAEQVLAHGSTSGQALALLSYIRRQYDWDWAGAAEAGRAAAAAAPGDASVRAAAGLAAFSLGDFNAAQTHFAAAVERDPLNLGTRINLGLAFEFAGDFDGALAAYRQVVALNPEFPGAHACRARVKALQGKGASAQRESEQEADPFWRRYAEILALTTAAADSGDSSPRAAQLLEAMVTEDGAVAAFQIAELSAFAGDVDDAYEWLERARRQHDGGMGALLGNPLLQGLRGDPRWFALLRGVGLPLDSDD
jgi:TolB-like protein/Tfp pilus assembly protein PilF